RRFQGIRLLVVAVGDQQDRLIAVGTRLKYFERLSNGVADRGAAPRCARGVELIERPAKRVVIDRERTLHHRLTGEGDQADALTFQTVHQRGDVGLGAAEPAGWDVLGQHRPRDVDHDVEIGAAGSDFLVLRAEARPGEGDQAGYQGRLSQEQLETEP